MNIVDAVCQYCNKAFKSFGSRVCPACYEKGKNSSSAWWNKNGN